MNNGIFYPLISHNSYIFEKLFLKNRENIFILLIIKNKYILSFMATVLPSKIILSRIPSSNKVKHAALIASSLWPKLSLPRHPHLSPSPPATTPPWPPPAPHLATAVRLCSQVSPVIHSCPDSRTTLLSSASSKSTPACSTPFAAHGGS